MGNDRQITEETPSKASYFTTQSVYNRQQRERQDTIAIV